IDRRTRYSIPIDSTDLPITPRYIDSLRLTTNVTILNGSKWLNSVSIQTSDAAALAKINSFSFVQSVSFIAGKLLGSSGIDKQRLMEDPVTLRDLKLTTDHYNYGFSYDQLHLHNGELLHNIGLRGQNMVIGIFDGGFQNYLTLRAFDSARTNGQILSTWDFVARETSVNEDHPHGMQCFSIIASNVPGQLVGSAPKANFHLFRSEDGASEYRIEEHNWVCAAERLDSAGGDLISSSLGYADLMTDRTQDHVYAELDGNTTIAAIGADLAAKKGILVVNSAGNEGSGSWHYILTPADGDSVLAIGAVNSSGAVGGFSSYGPSADGRIKPDVASVGVGTRYWSTSNIVSAGDGTSYACPNMAGLVTCLWQGFPEYNNMKIIQALRQASHQFATPDNRTGYGVPDIKKALIQLVKEYATSSATVNNCRTTITWNSKDMSAMRYEIERKLESEINYTKVGEVQGTGPVFSAHMNLEYEDVLTNVNPGTHSYRIRQVFDTAAARYTADYIDTTTISLATGCTPTSVDPINNVDQSITLIPNPATEHFVLRIMTTNPIQKLLIRIVNIEGQEVSVIQKSKTSGTSNFEIPVSRFAKGKYYVMVYNDGKLIQTKELIKL
ncbi:MAG: S8 family serine peptidase, partial [Flavisolibacter sp.]